MDNSFVLYSDVTTVYDQLIGFCNGNGLKVKDPKEKFYCIHTSKPSFFFWQKLLIDLKITAVEKEQVEVSVLVYKWGQRKPRREQEYRMAIESFFHNSQ